MISCISYFSLHFFFLPIKHQDRLYLPLCAKYSNLTLNLLKNKHLDSEYQILQLLVRAHLLGDAGAEDCFVRLRILHVAGEKPMVVVVDLVAESRAQILFLGVEAADRARGLHGGRAVWLGEELLEAVDDRGEVAGLLDSNLVLVVVLHQVFVRRQLVRALCLDRFLVVYGRTREILLLLSDGRALKAVRIDLHRPLHRVRILRHRLLCEHHGRRARLVHVSLPCLHHVLIEVDLLVVAVVPFVLHFDHVDARLHACCVLELGARLHVGMKLLQLALARRYVVLLCLLCTELHLGHLLLDLALLTQRHPLLRGQAIVR